MENKNRFNNIAIKYLKLNHNTNCISENKIREIVINQ